MAESTNDVGDTYIDKIAVFFRDHESQLAQSSSIRRVGRSKAASTRSWLSFTGIPWALSSVPSQRRPTLFSIDSERLLYLLLRFEGLGFDVGSLDSSRRVSSHRSWSYAPFVDHADSTSIQSFRSSLSVFTKLSIPTSLSSLSFSTARQPTDVSLRYLFSSFTKLPCLSLHSPSSSFPPVADQVREPFCLPIKAFRSLQTLEILDLDPRLVSGWDRLSQSLRSLTIRRSGIEDVAHVLIDAVVSDHSPQGVLDEEVEGIGLDRTSTEGKHLPPHSWAFLLSMSLAENGLTFIPTLPFLPALTHLDLSSNLLVSIPSMAASLPSLQVLNLSDNMIDSTLGAKLSVAAIKTLNLSQNRLTSLVGIDGLYALQRLDIRNNQVEESSEIGRLTSLPNLEEILLDGNYLEPDWRIRCFSAFAQSDSLTHSSPSSSKWRLIFQLPVCLPHPHNQ
ncbi:L domain-like protein [Sistotremastrum niveocremeum HHB9708]|uniref:L domain-like protein n=1 Tax=Sistotremastrum niveocremeum HHB9708 TaxID=1314777 RepID=A0A164V7W3_9AGAM|nr:L domain-like protein [Sistotremastrum niveocremeum HHB9708]